MDSAMTDPLASTVQVSSDQVSCDLEGEAVVLSLGDGTYYGLNEVGAQIWALIQEPIRGREIVEALLVEYDIDRATCEAEVLEFLDQLQAWGLITRGEVESSV